MFASTRELHYTVDFPYFDISFVVAFAAFPAAVSRLASFRVVEAFDGGADPMRNIVINRPDTREPVFAMSISDYREMTCH